MSEPTLMGLDFFRRATELAATLRREGQRVLHCRGYRLFFRHIAPPMRRMAGLLHAGQPATAIMPSVAASGRGQT